MRGDVAAGRTWRRAGGRISAAAVANRPTVRVPETAPQPRSSSSTASASVARIRSACRASVVPASVSSTRRPARRSSGVPAAFSRAAICWETPPGV
ncbi:hypothetical protein AB0O76_29110 [Streptomyces sp. NPDC086554]|uniref:hypothetical protein n=1 Tax=Streptomyces sp. NPDC086554 TaxID=3154864 RepID=UPI0034273985